MKFWELPKPSSWTQECLSQSQTSLLIYEAAFSLRVLQKTAFHLWWVMVRCLKFPLPQPLLASVALRPPQVPVAVWGSKVLPAVNGKEARETISKRACTSAWNQMGCSHICLREPANVVARPLAVAFEILSWSGKLSDVWEKGKHHTPSQEGQEGGSR